MTRLAGWVQEALRHPRHLLLGGLVAGLAAGPWGRATWPFAAVAAAMAVAASPWAAAWARGAPPAWPVLVVGVALAILAGAVVAQARVEALDATALAPLIGRRCGCRRCSWTHRRDPLGDRGRARAHQRPGPWCGRARAAAAGDARRGAARWPRPPTGAEVQLTGRLRALGRRTATSAVAARTRRSSVEALEPTGRRRGGLVGALDGVRRRAEEAMAGPLAAPEAALARGMVLGQDDALADDVREDFRASGLSHLLAASGTNVALLAALVLAVATAAGLGLTGRLLLALAAIAVYVPLAGGGPSIQRAGVMGGAALLAMLAGRPASRWYALLLAAAATLALSPNALQDVGWQLSFAAVVALLAIGPRLAPALRRVLPGPLAEALALTIAATLGTAPLVALHFGRLSVVSVAANLLAAPVVAPVMWLGAIAAIAGQLAPALAWPAAWLAGPPLGYLGWLARTAARMPGAETAVGVSPLGAVALYAALGGVVARAARAGGGAAAAQRVARTRARGRGVRGGARPRRRSGAWAGSAGRLAGVLPGRGAGRRDARSSTVSVRCWSTPGGRGARSCAGCARRACGDWTCWS